MPIKYTIIDIALICYIFNVIMMKINFGFMDVKKQIIYEKNDLYESIRM